MKKFDRGILGLTVALVLLAGGVARAEQVTKPNIILILADDMGYSDLGCYGGEIATPNLDQLAAGGMRFSQFYNSAKCEPTRASLMSGQYWQTCGLGITKGITMGQAMKLAGYDTFALGKWHMNRNPVERGFDRYFGHLSGASDYFRGNDTYRLDGEKIDVKTIDNFYATDANADYAIEFIDEAHQADPDKPFFMYLAFNAPHSPLHAWPEDIAKYRGKYRQGWDQIRKERYRRLQEQGIVQAGWTLPPRPETIPAWDTLTEEEKDFEDMRMAVYAAMVDRMDQAIGRLLAKVEQHGETDNTLVIFLSDNGASPYDHGRRSVEQLEKGIGNINVGLGWANASATPFQHYKRNMYNGGSCTPCIVHWPGGIKNSGTITDQCSHIIDLMATIVDAGGVQWPAKVDDQAIDPLPGKSLLPILAGEQRTEHDALYFQLFDHRAMISGDWKLASDWNRPWALYNLKEDRTEMRDRSASNPEKMNSMLKRWQAWETKNVRHFADAGGEPIYRHLHDAHPEYLGGNAQQPVKNPKGKNRKEKN
jgi:arylsulfatase